MRGERRVNLWAVVLGFLLSATGCVRPRRPLLQHSADELYGKTYFVPGAGNLGIGTRSVPAGLRRRGYRGSVETFSWTTKMGPAIDQVFTTHAMQQAALLARKIETYCRLNPGKEVNLIGHSAGTGVVTWALEQLRPDVQVNNVVLLASSLSARYDMTRALRHVKGRVWVFTSPKDRILRFGVPIIGTVDRTRRGGCAGIDGLDPPLGASRRTREAYRSKIVNIPYDPKRFGSAWAGSHIGVVGAEMIEKHVAPLIIGDRRDHRPGAGVGGSLAVLWLAG